MKKHAAAAICALILLSLTACGTSPGKNETNDQDRKNTEPLQTKQSMNTEPPSIETDTPEPGYSRMNPAPIGVEQIITDSYNGYDVSAKINSVTRGADALTLVTQANQFNESPGEGEEYIVVNATITALSASSDTAFSVYSYLDFSAFSSTNSQYEMPSVVDPEPELSGDFFEGGSITGNITLKVRTDDPAPKLVYLRDFDGSGGIWFSLK